MSHADAVLAEEEIVAIVYEANRKRHPKSQQPSPLWRPAEIVRRLLVLKHIR
jgi:transposase, IS5 family